MLSGPKYSCLSVVVALAAAAGSCGGDDGSAGDAGDGGEAGEGGDSPTSSTTTVGETGGPSGTSGETGGTADNRPIVIVMIGDGMGRGQLDTASIYAHGRPGALFMQSLPIHGEIVTGSLSGITDSAAAATAMATGRKTINTRIGTDEAAQPLETVIERAKGLGLGTGVVTTAYLPHATPGSFTAHRPSRHDPVGIAEDQALTVQPDVMLGGGAAFYLPAGPDSQRSDAGLIEPLMNAGYEVVTTANELSSVDPDASPQVVGLFAAEHMDYVIDKPADSPQPSLRDMSLTALDILDRDPDGFVLMIEGARIDMASHQNDIERTITETIAFDETIEAVAQWAQGRQNVTLLVTADHECGGLVPDPAAGVGEIPTVEWRWGQHTNARIDVFGSGPGADVFDGQIRDAPWIHAVAMSRIADAPIEPPAVQLTPDGHLADLRHQAAVQLNVSGYGVGHNQLDSLWLDADPGGLAIGIEGLFKWDRNTVVILVDVDFGAATGFAGLMGNLSDFDGRLDRTLSTMALTAPGVPGFGAELVVGAFGGIETRREDLLTDSGLRGIAAPHTQSANLSWLVSANNFGEGARVPMGVSGTPVAGEGFETVIPWTVLFPDAGGGVPPGARIAVAAILANDDGDDLSNQALPSFDAGTSNPGPTATALPGVVEFIVDLDEDGAPDGDAIPIEHRP